MRHALPLSLVFLTACSTGGRGSSTAAGPTNAGACLETTRAGAHDNCTDYAFTAAATDAVKKGVVDACANETNPDSPLVGAWTDGGACDKTGATGGCQFTGKTSTGTVWYFVLAAKTVQSQCASEYTDGTRNTFVPAP